jgi:hypothetical protein
MPENQKDNPRLERILESALRSALEPEVRPVPAHLHRLLAARVIRNLAARYPSDAFPAILTCGLGVILLTAVFQTYHPELSMVAVFIAAVNLGMGPIAALIVILSRRRNSNAQA